MPGLGGSYGVGHLANHSAIPRLFRFDGESGGCGEEVWLECQGLRATQCAAGHFPMCRGSKANVACEGEGEMARIYEAGEHRLPERNDTSFSPWQAMSKRRGTWFLGGLQVFVRGASRRIRFTSTMLAVNPTECNPIRWRVGTGWPDAAGTPARRARLAARVNTGGFGRRFRRSSWMNRRLAF